MIYTFYSYKGGVGRSMALANIAELLYLSGLKVLMVDWDLEAPGLERYFPSVPLPDILENPGVIELLTDYKIQMAKEVDENTVLKFTSPETYQYPIYPKSQSSPHPIYPESPSSSRGKLSILTAGRRSKAYFAKYSKTVLTFDWKDFYERWEGGLYFDWLREQFEKIADVTLIDSRTGVTEMGGVCTYQLADVIIMFCATNQQNLDGTYDMAKKFTASQVQKLRPERPLKVLIIPSRVEIADSNLVDKFKEQFFEKFSPFIPQIEFINIEQLWKLRIPYVPKYAYSETVAVREHDKASAEDMAAAFNGFTQILQYLRYDQLIQNRPDKVANELAYALSMINIEDRTKITQLLYVIEILSKYLSPNSFIQEDFKKLLIYASCLTDFAFGNITNIREYFSKLPIWKGPQIEIAGVALIIPKGLYEQLTPQVNPPNILSLETAWDIITKKLSLFEQDLTIETDVLLQFKLKVRITQIKEERAKIEIQIQALKEELANNLVESSTIEQRKYSPLQSQYDSITEKIKQLRIAWVLEDEGAVRFDLENEIRQSEVQREQIFNDLISLKKEDLPEEVFVKLIKKQRYQEFIIQYDLLNEKIIYLYKARHYSTEAAISLKIDIWIERTEGEREKIVSDIIRLAPSPQDFMQRHLQRKLGEFGEVFDIISEKLERLKRESKKGIEPDNILYSLNSKIETEEAERKKIVTRMEELEEKIRIIEQSKYNEKI